MHTRLSIDLATNADALTLKGTVSTCIYCRWLLLPACPSGLIILRVIPVLHLSPRSLICGSLSPDSTSTPLLTAHTPEEPADASLVTPSHHAIIIE